MIPMMLAKTLRDESLWTKNGWVAETKLDGVRVQVETKARGNRLWSRLGNDQADSHPWLRDLRLPQGLIFEGEMCVPGGSSNQTIEDREREVLVLFDILGDGRNVIPLPYSERRRKLEKFVAWLGHPRVQIVMLDMNGSKRAFFEEIVANGGEGIVIKDLSAPYVPGKRTWHWQKVKKVLEVDVLIVDCEGHPTIYPGGKMSEQAAKGWKNLRYGYVGKDGRPVVCGSLGVTGPKEELDKYISRVAVACCMGVYDSGALRHPGFVRLRDDKVAGDVTYESIIEAAGIGLIRTKRGG